jgi:outer membrane protein OmpA-like peptidoglycan-associated protein
MMRRGDILILVLVILLGALLIYWFHPKHPEGGNGGQVADMHQAPAVKADLPVPSVAMENARASETKTSVKGDSRRVSAEELEEIETQREEAERRSLELQRQLAAERANRQVPAADVERLRQQIDDSRRAAEARVEADRQAQQAQAAAQQAQAQLDQTRQLLAERDAEVRRLRIQNELARIASTRSEQRGLIVTLSGGILFDTGKTSLKPGAKSTLTRIAKQLQTDPSLKIALEGYTDNVGSAAENQALSEKRANAVRDYLVSAGIASDHITATGRGEEAPIGTNKTASGRQQNRRVELVITQ